jgi:hypothetical protein
MDRSRSPRFTSSYLSLFQNRSRGLPETMDTLPDDAPPDRDEARAFSTTTLRAVTR